MVFWDKSTPFLFPVNPFYKFPIIHKKEKATTILPSTAPLNFTLTVKTLKDKGLIIWGKVYRERRFKIDWEAFLAVAIAEITVPSPPIISPPA